MPRKGGLSTESAKARVIEAIGQGVPRGKAMEAVSLSIKTYENWRSSDKDFARAVDAARDRYSNAKEAGLAGPDRTLGFAEWRKKYLGRDTYPHQQAWVDILEGREPKIMPGWSWTPARPDRLIVNTPPYMAKSSTVTVDYTTYRVCMNPNVRIVILSQALDMAKRFLYQVKSYLTDPRYIDLQMAYAPEGDFKGEVWTQTAIYVKGRDSSEKDPTVQALGWNGQIQGQRADLIICDDIVTMSNLGDVEKMAFRMSQDIASRLYDGKLLIIGTRVGPKDLYDHLLDGDNFLQGSTPWSHLKQPAVSKFAEDPKDWVTLWPRSTQPLDENDMTVPDEDGTYPAWDGPKLAKVRAENPPRTWALLYQQDPISDDSVFPPVLVMGAVDKRRKPGPMRPGEWGGRREGMEGLHVVGSVDPAGTGEAFVLVYAVDRSDGTRWVLNAWTADNTKPSWYADRIEQLTPEYQVDEWVIESNAYASWLIHDERIVAYLRNRGVKLTPHYTGRNKQDADFGVATMATLFGTTKRHVEGGREVHAGDNIIHIPDPDKSEGIKALIEQLISWQPGKLGRQLRQDGPMSLWFAELRARLVVTPGQEKRPDFLANRYLSRSSQARRFVAPARYHTS